ncbi:hypothetical protein HOG21_01400 [bacterium]|jgi:hypothetical protein|nr:hypothetical protein [bacterium]
MNKIKTLIFMLIFVFSLSLVNAANISNIETVDKNTIEITTDTNIKFSE